jgi:hypothetical protein
MIELVAAVLVAAAAVGVLIEPLLVGSSAPDRESE